MSGIARTVTNREFVPCPAIGHIISADAYPISPIYNIPKLTPPPDIRMIGLQLHHPLRCIHTEKPELDTVRLRFQRLRMLGYGRC